MKKCLLFVGLLVSSMSLMATVHTVMVSSNQFSPATLPNVFVGDVIHWQWVDGSHTTTCDPSVEPGTSLPAGAPTWDERIRAASPTYDYTVQVPGTYVYYCSPHAPAMQGTFTASVVTPVKLTAFLVSGNEQASLVWKTENEKNTDYFSIRRSSNGSDYEEIAKVPATGVSTGEKVYSFTDSKISATQKYYYYNLAVVDKDGKKTFSNVRMYKNSKAPSKLILTVSPNPISKEGHLNMTFNAEKEGKLAVRVIDPAGKTIISRNMSAYPGVNNGHVHLGPRPSGTYTLVCALDGITESHQIVVP